MSIGTLANINEQRCAEIAKLVKLLSVPCPKEDVPSLPFTREQEANYWLFLVAICHQTTPLTGTPLGGLVDGIERRGWDYLVHSFLSACVDDATWLSVDRWATFTRHDIINLFGESITDPVRRAALIQDLSRILRRHGWKSVLTAVDKTQHRIRSSCGTDLLALLRSFEAFSDPAEKKSAFFLALMSNAGLWEYADPENLPAPVDYHELRGHLRIGTVVICDELRSKMVKREVLSAEEDACLRLVVRDAIHLIARAVSASPNALHYLFWNLFRNYCVRDTPRCRGENFERLPSVYAEPVAERFSCECPFRGCCDSADQVHAINEPIVQTSYY